MIRRPVNAEIARDLEAIERSDQPEHAGQL
jgi:hypothetical protein